MVVKYHRRDRRLLDASSGLTVGSNDPEQRILFDLGHGFGN